MVEKIRNLKQKLGKWFWVIPVITLIIVWRILVGVNKTTKVQTVQVSQGNLVESVSTSGTIKADQYSVLTFPSGGKVAAVWVKAGQRIQKGALIAQLDPITLNAVYQEALNTRRNTQAAVDNVHDQVKNNDSAETFVQKATRTAAEVANDNAWDAVLAARDNLANATIYAPFAGIIDTVSPSSPGMQVLPGAANYTIVNPDTVYFDAEVEETDLPHVAVGQTVNIKLDAYPNDAYQGTVTSIGMVAFTSATGGNAYHVRISLPENTDMKFKVGMGGDTDIIFNTIENVLKVPVSAVTVDSNNYVWEVIAGRAKKVTIETGGENNDEMEVKSGVKEGDTVISNPPASIKDGQKVSI
jgi:RND family efflux transporter MFP subunit